MSVISFLPAFLAGCMELRTVCHDDVVAAVGRGIPDWLVFSHQQDGDPGCEATKRGGAQGRGLRGWERTNCCECVVGGGC